MNKVHFVEQNLFVDDDLEELQTKYVEQNRRGGFEQNCVKYVQHFADLFNEICLTYVQYSTFKIC